MPGGMWWEMWPHSRWGPVSDGLRLVLQATVMGCVCGGRAVTPTQQMMRDGILMLTVVLETRGALF